MSVPAVSVGLPIYNGEIYLRSSLDSLLAQTFTDFELIISDNASTDGTAEICSEYAARDPRIRYHRNDQNLGVVANEKRVVELARAPYFRFAASDDLCAPNHLETCVKVLSENPEAVLVYPQISLIDEKSQPVEDYEEGLDLREPAPHLRLSHLLKLINMCNAPFGLMRTDTFRRLEGIQNFPAYDVAYLAHLSLYGKFLEIPERLFFRRIYLNKNNARHMSIHQRTVRMNTRLSGHIFFPYWTILRSLIAGILRAPLSLNEKLLSLAVLRVWIFRYKGSLYWDLRMAASQILTGERFISNS